MIKDEIWKSIPGYEGYYEISNLGKVKRLKRITSRKNTTCVITEKLLSLVNNTGYWTIGLTDESKNRKYFKVHRLVALAFISNPLNLPQVNHKDGNKKNNTVENLEWCDASYNLTHAHNMGLVKMPRGEESGRSQLDSLQVLVIKVLLESSALLRSDIAKYFNMTEQNIRSIETGRTWKHITTTSLKIAA